MTLCPGKFQPWSMSGGWNRSMDLDIRELKKAEVGHVVSLVTTEEMEELEVMDLGKSCILPVLLGITYRLQMKRSQTDSCGLSILFERSIKLMPNFSEGSESLSIAKAALVEQAFSLAL